LALLSYLRPNLMLLDEPTNHLDLEMRQALAMALQDYEGAVVLVSHDRHLLRTVADRFYLVADGRVQPSKAISRTMRAGLRIRPVLRVYQPLPWTLRPLTPNRPTRPPTIRRPQSTPPGRSAATHSTGPTQGGGHALGAAHGGMTTQRSQLESALTDTALYAETSRPRLRELLAQQTAVLRAIGEAEEKWLDSTQRFEDAENMEPS